MKTEITRHTRMNTTASNEAAYAQSKPTRARANILPKSLAISLRYVGEAALLLVLTRAMPIAGGAPFAIALMVAMLFNGHKPLPMLIGCLLGSPWERMGLSSLGPILGCLAALFGYWALKKMPFWRKEESGRLHGDDMWCAVLAGGAMLISALPFVRELPYDLIMAPLNALLAAASAPTLISAITINPKRDRLLTEEKISLALLGLALLIGLRMMPFVGTPLAHLFATLFTLLAAMCSVGAGAVAGVLCGSALMLLGDAQYIGITLALCGLMAGAVRPLG